MAILQRSNVRHRQRCEMFGCNNLATHQIGRNPKSVAYTMRICDECLMSLKRIAEEVLAGGKAESIATVDTATIRIGAVTTAQIADHGITADMLASPEKLPFEPEISVSPEASTDEEMEISPSEMAMIVEAVQDKPVGTMGLILKSVTDMNDKVDIPTNHMQLLKYAAEKGMVVDYKHTTNDEVHAYLREKGLM